MVAGFVLAAFLLGVFPQAASSTRAAADPRPSAHLGVLDSIVKQAIEQDQIPGAVVLVWHNGAVVYRKAFGHRSLEPRREPMTVDTIFDLASLTKVIATTTAVMQLVQNGQVRLNDPVAKYLPEFAQNGKDDITVRELMTHFSGLPPDLDLAQKWQGRDTALRMAFATTPMFPPGSRFLYSDINFITLGALVERVSGTSLDQYCATHIFAPLKMTHTRFLPPKAGCRGLLPPNTIPTPARCCAAQCTIRPRAAWAEWQGTRACFPPPTISRNSLRRCSRAARCSARSPSKR